MQLTGNTIFITGGGSGIGRGLAEAFHKRGNTVIIAGRRKAALKAVTDANPGMASLELDITSPESIAAAAQTLIRDYPDLNVLFNNAGIMPFDNPAEEIDDRVATAIINTNLLGPIRMTSALIAHLKSKPRATVIHNTSVVAYLPLAANAVYSATKAALHSYTLTQRFALRDTSVKVLEIAPPWVDTDLIYKSGDPRSMPLEAFVAETMAKLGTDANEIYVDAIAAIRDNPGVNEHALINAFNQSLIDNPIPVG